MKAQASAATPPSTLDELIDKLLFAWRELGGEITDADGKSFRQAWEKNDRLPNLGLHMIIRDQVPVRHFPAWRAAIIELVNQSSDTELASCNRALFSALSLFLDVGALYLMPVLRQELLRPYNLPGSVPRDAEEIQQIADALAQIPNADVQHHGIKLITRNHYGRIKAADIDPVLFQLLPQLETGALNFPSSQSDGSYYGSDDAHRFCESLEDPNLLAYLFEHAGEDLHCELFYRMNLVASQLADGHDNDENKGAAADFWRQLSPYVQQYAPAYIQVGSYSTNADLIQALWHSELPAAHDLALSRMIAAMSINAEHSAHWIEQLNEKLSARPDSPNEKFIEELKDIYEIETLYELWQLNHSGLHYAITATLAHNLKERSYDDEGGYVDEHEEEEGEQETKRKQLRELIQQSLITQGENFNRIKPAQLATLLPYMDQDEVALAALPHLQPLASKSKPLREKLGNALSKISPQHYGAWLDDRRKAVREVALEGLLHSQDSAATPLLQTALKDSKVSDADKDRIANRLGHQVSNEDASNKSDSTINIEALEAKAEQAKIKPQITKLWSPTLAEQFTPLSETIGRWLLSMCLESKDSDLPLTVQKALQHLSRERQAQLTDYLVNYWLSQNGDSKLRWVMKFVPHYGDDRIVEAMLKGFQGWFKRAKPKAVFVLETLGALGTNYALSQVQQVYGKNTYSYALQEGAEKTLQAAAQKRGVELLDLFDELTPDFGMNQDGLKLDVGGNAYLVSIAGDLSLRVKNLSTNKITKSFPSAKKNDDPDKHANASNQFKLLRSNLKKVAKQQAKRLFEAMVAERRWPLARWQILFQQHPLLGLLGQSLIWSTDQNQSFRISEDHSPIDYEDEDINLQDDDLIRLWHPSTAPDAAEAVPAWRQHFEDYELTPLFDQLGQPLVDLSATELQAQQLDRYANLKVNQFTIRRFMESWNYSQHDGDGSWIASYIAHFPLCGVAVILNLDDMESFTYYDEQTATIQSFEFYRQREKLKLADVPKPVLATIISHGNAFKAQASAS